MKYFFPPLLTTTLTAALLSTSAPSAQAGVIDLSKPVGDSITPTGVYWTFDEGTKGTHDHDAKDHSGNGYDGVLTPGTEGASPTYTEGKFGNGIQIQATSPTLLDPNVFYDGTGQDVSAIDFSGKEFTVGLWLKLNSYNEGASQTIFLVERGNSIFPNSATRRNFFSFRLLKSSNDTWQLNLMIGDGEQESISVSSSTAATGFNAPNDLDWHQFAFSLKPTEGGSLLQFYLDGESLGGEKFIDRQIAAITDDTAKRLRVGERNSSSYQSVFDGTIDDFFMTEGVHTFAIPEPGTTLLLLPVVGLGLLAMNRRTSQRCPR